MGKVLVIFAIVFAAFIGIVVYQFYFRGQTPQQTNGATATINEQTYKLTVVKEQEDQQLGLSKYSSLPQDHGMLFEFPKADYYNFWMKDMKFPIDIIFINGDKIVSIAKNVPAPKKAEEDLPLYQPEGPANKVLEISAGLAEKNGYKKGDTVKIETKAK